MNFELYGNKYQNTKPSPNLFDKNTMVINGAINVNTNIFNTTDEFRTAVIKCKPNTTYTISKIVSNRFVVCAYDSALVSGAVGTKILYNDSATSITFTTDTNSKYLAVMFSKITKETADLNEILNSIQIEEGSNATSYQPYTGPVPNPNNARKIEVMTGRQEINVVGKNLLNSLGTNNAGTTVTSNGINYTFNEDGSITIQGTSTGLSLAYLLGNDFRDYSVQRFFIDEDYVVNGWDNNNITLVSRGIDGIYRRIKGTNSVDIKNIEISVIYIQIASGTTINETIYPMIRKASIEDDTYEPYKSKTYEINLGKNLFDGELELGTYTDSGEKYHFAGAYRNKNIISIQSNTTYTFSINGISQKYVVYFYDNNKSFLSSLALTNGTFTTPNNCYYINFRCYNADFTSDYADLKVQLELGDKATSYAKFMKNNLFTNKNLTDNHAITTNGELTETAYWCISDYMRVGSNQKIIYKGLVNIGSNAVQCAYYDSNYNFISTFKQATGTNTITTPNNAEYVRFSIFKGADQNTFIIWNTAEAQYPIGLSDEDYIHNIDDKWYIHRELKKRILDGNENWIHDGTKYDDKYYLFYTNSLGLPIKQDSVLGISDYFRGIAYNDRTIDYENTFYINDWIGIIADKDMTNATNATEFKSWLSNNNITIWEKLETPIEEEIKNEELITQLNELNNSISFEGTNNIFSSGDLPMILNAYRIVENETGKLEFGIKNESSAINIINDSHIPYGLLITFIANGTVVNPILKNSITNETMKLDFSLEAGEQIIVNSYDNEKSISHIDAFGNSTDITNSLLFGTKFLQAKNGSNNFIVSADSGKENLDCSISYFNYYEAI